MEWGSGGDEQGMLVPLKGVTKEKRWSPKRVRKEFVAAVESEKNTGQREDAVVLGVSK